MFTLNHHNFIDKVQSILETYYLKPLDGSKKQNLKDGYIERMIHGAEHPSRAMLWLFITDKLLQRLTPDYVNSSYAKIAKYLSLDIESVKLLILLTMVCHDAARKSEGTDEWEAASAKIALDILKVVGLEEQQAKLFAKAIQFKDKRKDYLYQLKKLGIDKQDYNAFDYIRKLVNLADNLELMRCVGSFRSSYIFDTLSTVDGFDKDLHQSTIFQLIKAIHQFIYEQSDMLFACTVYDLANKVVVSHKSRHSLKQKVKYEHADNVFAAIFAKAKNNDFFSSFLTDFVFEVSAAKLYQLEPAFNPFIHGTNSAILSLLPKTNFQIMSPIEMIRQFKTAPVSGEFKQGGYDAVSSISEEAEQSSIGMTSFGRMLSTGFFELDTIIDKYTGFDIINNDNCIKNFRENMGRAFNVAFSNINLLLIYFTQARQLQVPLEQMITDDELETLQANMEATLQFYYFLQLLGSRIQPDFEEINQSNMKKDIADVAYDFFTFENIINKIKINKIDIEKIVADPSKENLQKALKLLEFPEKKCQVTTFGLSKKEIELTKTQFFTCEKQYIDTGCSVGDVYYSFRNMSKNLLSYRINHFLKEYILGTKSLRFFEKIAEIAPQQITALKDRIALFKELIAAPQSQFQLSDQQFFVNKYPLVFVSDAEEIIVLHNNTVQEYRSTAPLKLGKEITIIATDNHDHRLEIVKYLQHHQINNVQVVLFDDLRHCKVTRKRPVASQHNADRVVTLSNNNNSLFDCKVVYTQLGTKDMPDITEFRQ